MSAGNVTLTGVTVTDPFADAGSVTLVADAASADGILGVGETWHYTAAHTVLQSEIPSDHVHEGTLTNTATVTDDQFATADASASVTVINPEPPCPPVETLSNGSFENGLPPQMGHFAVTALDGWDNTGASDHGIEIWDQSVADVYAHGLQTIGGHLIETDSWGSGNLGPVTGDVLDNLVTHVNAIAGEDYVLSFDYSARDGVNVGGNNTTDSFDVLWNGSLVDHFDPTAVQWVSSGEYHLTGLGGDNTLEIREAGANDSVGALIDNVQVIGCAPCVPVDVPFNGSFEDQLAPQMGHFAVTALAGWDNLGASDHGIEIWDQSTTDVYAHNLQTFGGHLIETDSWGSGNLGPVTGNVLDDLVTHPTVVAGQDYNLSFNFSARDGVNVGGNNTTDSFDVLWNGVSVGHFDPTAVQWVSSGNIQITGAAGVNTLEIKEAGANDSIGALVDNIHIMTVCPDTHQDVVHV
jgi:hypothetical protein